MPSDLLGFCAGPLERRCIMGFNCGELGQSGFKPTITFQHFGLMEVVKLKRLDQGKDVLSAVIEPPRVYRGVKLSKDGPCDTKKAYPDVHG